MALIKKPGCKNWIFQCSIGKRKWSRSTGESNRKKAEAKIPKLRRLAQLHRELPNNSSKLKTSIVQEVSRIEQDVSSRQACRVGCGLRNFFNWSGDISLESIDTSMLERYQRLRLKTKARGTVDKEITYVLKLLAQNRFKIDKPTPKQGKVTEIRSFSHDELVCFFNHCPEEWKTAFLTMLATGARPAELIPSCRSGHIALLKPEIRKEDNSIIIRSAKNRAGYQGKKRIVQIPEELTGMLIDQADSNPGRHVFPHIDSLGKLFNRIIKEAGIRKVDDLGQKVIAHSFRHTYATMMSEAVNGNAFVLKSMLGHSQISTTDRYIHPSTPAIVIEMSFLFPGGGKRGWKDSEDDTKDAM
jgi:integrase